MLSSFDSLIESLFT